MVWILGALALALVLLLAERLVISPEDQLTTEDALALPHGRVRLVGRLERYVIRFIDPPVRGATLEFFEGEKRLGSATTDDRGVASIEIDAGPPGERRFRVLSSRSDEALVVRVLPADSPVLVLDLDHTIIDISTTRFAFTHNRRTHPLPDAVDAVKRLASRFTVVYLTARDHSFLAKTRDWLHQQALPDGPLLMRRKRFWSQAPLDHKVERLGEVRKTHRLIAGVGDLPSDAKAYLANGMTAYLMDPSGAVPALDGAIAVRGWKELEAKLTAGPSTT
jgi:hypothetical protein